MVLHCTGGRDGMGSAAFRGLTALLWSMGNPVFLWNSFPATWELLLTNLKPSWRPWSPCFNSGMKNRSHASYSYRQVRKQKIRLQGNDAEREVCSVRKFKKTISSAILIFWSPAGHCWKPACKCLWDRSWVHAAYGTSIIEVDFGSR